MCSNTLSMPELLDRKAMLWIVAILLPVVVLCIWYYRENEKYRKPLENMPGPPGLPVIGNALNIASTTEILPFMMKCVQKYGGIFKANVATAHMVVCSDARNCEYILNSTKLISKAWQYDFFHKWLGTGLLTSTGDKWRNHRKLITPAFHFTILEDFIGIFVSASEILIQKLGREVGKDTFDLYPFISLCTLDIICESAMGTKVNAQEDSDSEYVKSVREMGRIVMERTYSLKMFQFFYRFTRDYQTEKRCLKVLHDYSKGVIKRKREQMLNDCKDTKTGEDDMGIKRRLAFLDLLIQESNASNYYVSDDDLREEVDTIMFEGHDTTSIAISMLLYSLSLNPVIQRKVVTELDYIFADIQGREISYSDLHRMKYLELVIKETLRMYPSVPGFARNVTEATEIDGHNIPKGTSMGCFVYALHRNPEIFPEPEKFIPERFETTNRQIPPFAYIPFSAGPRNCIGQKFAMLEMKLVVAKVLRNFEILPAVPFHKPVLAAESVLKSANGVHVRLRQRVVK